MKHLTIAGLLGLSLACSSTAAQQAKGLTPTDVVATVGSAPITLADVDTKAMQAPVSNFGNVRLSQAVYEARRQALDTIIDDILIDQDAKARGIERTKLVEQEVGGKVAQPTDAEVVVWFQANQGRLQGAAIDQVRAPIRTFLIQERMGAARQAYLDGLKGKATVHVSLEPPRQIVASQGHESRGPANAPIELIEFSDFQCPYCLRAYPTLQQVLSTYGDRIRFVYRHYPLQNHPNARPAAEAAACAGEQGKFWPYHDRLFADPNKLADGDLKAGAAQLGLDAAQFNACVDAHKFKAAIDRDIKEGDEVGVNGTPAFFINGRMLSGAQPFDAFKRVIDEELQLKKKG